MIDLLLDELDYDDLQEVLLVVSGSEKLEVSGVSGIADRLQDHVVSLLDGDESNVFHGLHEGQSLTQGSSSLIVQVAILKFSSRV